MIFQCTVQWFLRRSILLCNHHHSSPELLHFAKLKFYTHYTVIPHSPFPQSLTITTLLSIFIILTKSSHNWSNVYLYGWLISHSISSKIFHVTARQNFLPFERKIIFHFYVYTTFCLPIHLFMNTWAVPMF